MFGKTSSYKFLLSTTTTKFSVILEEINYTIFFQLYKL